MSETQQPTFGIEKIYVKDLSLEVPGGPQTFMQGEQPQLEVQITQQSQRVNELLFEVTLVITVSAKRGDKTLFLVEASQAGVFQIRNVPDADLAPVLGIVCPNVLFPYARETVSDVVRDRKSTRLNSSHRTISYAVSCLKKKMNHDEHQSSLQFIL